MPPFRLSPAATLIDDQIIGSQFLREENSVAFTGIETGFQELRVRSLTGSARLEPCGRLGDPQAHRVRRVQPFQFGADRGRNENATVELRQYPKSRQSRSDN